METQDIWMHKYLKYKEKCLQIGGGKRGRKIGNFLKYAKKLPNTDEKKFITDFLKHLKGNENGCYLNKLNNDKNPISKIINKIIKEKGEKITVLPRELSDIKQDSKMKELLIGFINDEINKCMMENLTVQPAEKLVKKEKKAEAAEEEDTAAKKPEAAAAEAKKEDAAAIKIQAITRGNQGKRKAEAEAAAAAKKPEAAETAQPTTEKKTSCEFSNAQTVQEIKSQKNYANYINYSENSIKFVCKVNNSTDSPVIKCKVCPAGNQSLSEKPSTAETSTAETHTSGTPTAETSTEETSTEETSTEETFQGEKPTAVQAKQAWTDANPVEAYQMKSNNGVPTTPGEGGMSNQCFWISILDWMELTGYKVEAGEQVNVKTVGGLKELANEIKLGETDNQVEGEGINDGFGKAPPVKTSILEVNRDDEMLNLIGNNSGCFTRLDRFARKLGIYIRVISHDYRNDRLGLDLDTLQQKGLTNEYLENGKPLYAFGNIEVVGENNKNLILIVATNNHFQLLTKYEEGAFKYELQTKDKKSLSDSKKLESPNKDEIKWYNNQGELVIWEKLLDDEKVEIMKQLVIEFPIEYTKIQNANTTSGGGYSNYLKSFI